MGLRGPSGDEPDSLTVIEHGDGSPAFLGVRVHCVEVFDDRTIEQPRYFGEVDPMLAKNPSLFGIVPFEAPPLSNNMAHPLVLGDDLDRVVLDHRVGKELAA